MLSVFQGGMTLLVLGQITMFVAIGIFRTLREPYFKPKSKPKLGQVCTIDFKRLKNLLEKS